MSHGIYKVVGTRDYRRHPTGTEFSAQLDPFAEQRAIGRGDIILIRREIPTVPTEHQLPPGWAADHDKRQVS